MTQASTTRTDYTASMLTSYHDPRGIAGDVAVSVVEEELHFFDGHDFLQGCGWPAFSPSPTGLPLRAALHVVTCGPAWRLFVEVSILQERQTRVAASLNRKNWLLSDSAASARDIRV